MNILFLDDSKERQDKLWEVLRVGGFDLYHLRRCFTAQEAISWLDSGQWGYVFLDHDLGNEIYADSHGENTGAEVTRWILKNKTSIKNVIVHSFNPSGAEVMLSNLIQAGFTPIYAPFNGAVFNSILKDMCDGDNDV